MFSLKRKTDRSWFACNDPTASLFWLVLNGFTTARLRAIDASFYHHSAADRGSKLLRSSPGRSHPFWLDVSPSGYLFFFVCVFKPTTKGGSVLTAPDRKHSNSNIQLRPMLPLVKMTADPRSPRRARACTSSSPSQWLTVKTHTIAGTIWSTKRSYELVRV